MNFRSAIGGVACVSILLLAGCSTSDPVQAPTTATQPPAKTTSTSTTGQAAATQQRVPAPDILTVPAASIEGLTTTSTSDEEAHIQAVAPVLDGAEPVTTLASAFVDAQVAAYREATAASTEKTFISVGWSTLAASPDVVGLLQTSNYSLGGSFASENQTIWYDVASKRLLTLSDLVTPAGLEQVTTQVKQSLTEQIDSPRLDVAEQLIKDNSVTVAFDAKGQLLVGFNAFDVASGADGSPLIAITGDTAALLSPVGLKAQQAALKPSRIEVQAPPAPPAPEAVDCTTQQCVAITFDDGPSASTTPRLLDILQQKDAKATFFVLGSQAEARPDLVQREVREGHEVGNHTWSHPQLPQLSDADLRSELTKTQKEIEKATGVTPTLLRPPYGARDAKVDRAAKDLGLAEALWSIDTLDWKHHNHAKIVAAAKKAKPGSIILMHDIHATTVDSVADVIDTLRAKGYVLVTVSQLEGETQPGAKYYGAY